MFRKRIDRGGEAFSIKKLGAFGSHLQALSAFFEHPWSEPSPDLPEASQAWLLNEAGFVLRALGRLPEAVKPLEAVLKRDRDKETWKEAAISAGNLSELTQTLGRLDESTEWARESVESADRSEDAIERMMNRTKLGDALHQQGEFHESAAAFREAEELQAGRQPGYPRLYSVQGYLYCDLLLSLGAGGGYREACKAVLERAEEALKIVLNGSKGLLDIALAHLTLGRAHLGLALATPDARQPHEQAALKHLDEAVEGLRRAGHEDYLPRGLIARAQARRLLQNPKSAHPDLEETLEIAERGSMLLFQADAHLELACVYLALDDPEKAQESYEEARRVVEETGYWRRRGELERLAAALSALHR